MLKQLYIKNFKSLLDNKLLLKPLTLLTGLNSSGKSSALQALRMLERYYRYGDPVISDLGRLWDLKSNLSKKNGFSIECTDSSDKTYSLLADFKDSNSVKISSKPALSSKVQFPSLCYISADRSGPRPFLP
jgi:AAA15 family ATPase/GTPase